MAIVDRNTLKQWFIRGARPTAEQFAAGFDSFFHKDDSIPAENVEGLQEAFNVKADKKALDTVSEQVQELRKDFNSSTNSMNNAAEAAYAAQHSATEAAQAAQEATQVAVTVSNEAKEEIDTMRALRYHLTISAALVPTRMELSYPAVVSIRNSGVPRVVARLFPVYALQNVLFLPASGDAVTVLPDGRIIMNHTGSATVYVIPTNATHLHQSATITVRNPYLRKVSGGGLRKTSAGHLRIV
jgi:ribosomal protein L12E/L44/L45/RPP1/RPP2